MVLSELISGDMGSDSGDGLSVQNITSFKRGVCCGDRMKCQ
ncbi:hypothetical protein GP5015_587 [gamma proteobacterium HTCC5015]|nr:hypothetical protein GP5015_587 [gamma proteobacterium HTCC5015]